MEKIKCPICGTLIDDDDYVPCPYCAWAYVGIEEILDPNEREAFNLMSVNEAKKLLAQSNLPINTVSIYVGYSNFSYFTKMFKENTGYSPLDYRRKFRQI